MTGRIVLNTGPVISLALIDRIDIHQKLFQEVSIPDAVHKELLEGVSSGQGLPSYNKVTWIQFLSLST